MPATEPTTELDARFSSEGVTATAWAEGRQALAAAELYWLSTVRPDGRPHVTPVLSIWLDDALYFCTGPTERKADNLLHNKHCILTTGRNSLNEGLDLVIEGDAVSVTDNEKLQKIADAYESKYGSDWRFDVTDDALVREGDRALVFEVAPSKGFGFGKGEFRQTRWRF